jgi:hypothetical protein
LSLRANYLGTPVRSTVRACRSMWWPLARFHAFTTQVNDMTNQNWHGDKQQDNEQKSEHDKGAARQASNACLETSCEMSHRENQDAQSGEQKDIHR